MPFSVWMIDFRFNLAYRWVLKIDVKVARRWLLQNIYYVVTCYKWVVEIILTDDIFFTTYKY